MILRHFKRRVLKRKIHIGGEIDPDEIFLDSTNLPDFDVHQFEGRLEKPIHAKTFVWFSISCAIVALFFVGKLWNLQIVHGETYKERSENNRLDHSTIFANRGVIYDRNRVPLAWNELNPEGEFPKRAYATSSGFAHVLGYVQYPAKDKFGVYYQTEFIPKDGVELEFNKELTGINGLKITETNALGHTQSESVLEPPKDGTNVMLSVDKRVQAKLFESLEATVRERGFLAGAGVIMDIHNGEIIAMTSFPEYDPEIMSQGSNKSLISEYLTDARNPFLDRVVSGQFIPGSIMKPFIAVGALEENIIDPLKQIHANGQITIPNRYNPSNPTIFKDWKVHGWVDMRKAIAVSSNVYFFAIGGGYEDQKGIGIANIEKYIRGFGFGTKTGIDVLGEKEGTIPSPEWKAKMFEEGDWRIGDTYNSSIGQYGFQVTPIQAVRAVAGIANGGVLVTPTVLLDNPVNDKKTTVIPYADRSMQIVREGMRQGVLEGTASGLNIPGVNAAAKTGTAELGVSKQEVNSWVMGYWPYENPRYAFTVLMEKGPRANQVGATYVMRQTLEWMTLYAEEYFD